MKIKFLLAGLGFMFASSANAIDFGVGVKAGTVGVGADISIALTQTINARLSLTQADFNQSESIDISDANSSATIDSDINLDFSTTSLLFDWYVFDGTFHVTAGMMKNDSSVSLVGNLTNTLVTFEGTTYNVDDAFSDRSMTGRVNFGDSFEPYFGIGWGRKADDDPGLSLSVELGVVLLDPSVQLTAPTLVTGATDTDGNPVTQDQLQAEVDAAEQTANNDLSDFEMWPVLSVGLNYAF